MNPRDLFTHHTRGITWLNHAAISPLPAPARRAMEQFLEERSNGPIENFREWETILTECRERVRRLISAGSADRIAFTANTSEGLSLVAEGIDWNPGDEILLNDMEFPANIQPFRALQSRGVRLNILEVPEGRLEPDRIEKALTPATRMIAISAVQYLHGFRADLNAIGELCRRHELWFVVDGIQALGAVPVDVEAAGIDALATGGHKWLMGPMGAGFLYLSDRLQHALRPARTGWLSVERPMEMRNYEQPWLGTAAYYETGTRNMIGISGLNASLELLLETGRDRIESSIRSLTQRAIDRIQEMDGVRLISPEDPGLRAGIVTFRLESGEVPDPLAEQLAGEGIHFSIRDGMIRISPHFYNLDEEVDRFFDRFAALRSDVA